MYGKAQDPEQSSLLKDMESHWPLCSSDKSMTYHGGSNRQRSSLRHETYSLQALRSDEGSVAKESVLESGIGNSFSKRRSQVTSRENWYVFVRNLHLKITNIIEKGGIIRTESFKESCIFTIIRSCDTRGEKSVMYGPRLFIYSASHSGFETRRLGGNELGNPRFEAVQCKKIQRSEKDN